MSACINVGGIWLPVEEFQILGQEIQSEELKT